MSVVEPGPVSSGLIQRVQDILLRPKPTWDVIDVEPATVQGLFTGYAAILAAIPAVVTILGSLVLASVFPFGLPVAIVMAIASYVLGLVGIFVIGLVIDALAPSFDGQKNQIQAMKLAVYPFTAVWIASILNLIPVLGTLLVFLASLYGLYILYLGLPKLMKAPQEKALGYTIVAVIVAFVIQLIIGAVVAGVAGMSMLGGAAVLANNAATVQVGDSKVNVMAAAKQVEQAAKQIEAGATGEGVQPVDVEVLKAQLPNAVAGFARTDVTTGSGGVGGISGSSAEGKYQKGDARITLTVVDMGAAGGIAGLAGAFNVSSSSESQGRYEKVGRVDGRMTMEEFDRTSGHGEYGVMVADRFMVQAEGDSGASMNDLKAAVTSVNFARLEGLARAS